MIDYAQLFIGIVALMLSVWYLVWARVRGTVLRQELFEIRDELWDAAYREQAFDDAAYNAVRGSLNNMIRFAPIWSLPTFLVALADESTQRKPAMPKSDNEELQNAIDRALVEATNALRRAMVFYRPVSGLIYYVTFGTLGFLGQSIKQLLMRPIDERFQDGAIANARS